MSYSTDEEDEQDNKKNDKSKKKNAINKDKNDKPSTSKDDDNSDGDSGSDKNSDNSDSEDENDLHARLLASMEKEAIPEETEEDLMTPRSKSDTKPNPTASAAAPKPTPVPAKPNQNNISKQPTTTSVSKSKAPEKVATKPTTNKPKEQPTPVPVKKDSSTNKAPSLKVETVNNKNYKNGPVIDFQEQIRKISSIDQPDASQLVIPNKPGTIAENVGEAGNNPHDDEMHHAINDILKDENKDTRPRTGKRRSSVPSRPVSGDSGPCKGPVAIDNDKKLKELEEDIVRNHKESGTPSRKPSHQDEETMKKGAEVDNLISELNL